MGSPKALVCGMDEWLETLRDPRARLEIESFFRRVVAPEFQIGPRRLEAHLVYLLLAGRMEAQWNERTETLGAGGFLWLAPGVRHAFRRVEPSTLLNAFALRFFLRRGGRVWRPAASYLFLPDAGHLITLFERLYDEFMLRRPYREARLQCLLYCSLSEAARRAGDARRPGPVFGEPQQRRLLKAMEERPEARCAPADLAARMGMSRDYFARVFRNTFGASPRKKLLEFRMRKAAQRLEESSRNVSEVAYEFGYASPYLFSRQFKQVLGVTPSHYRRRRFE